MSRVNDIINGWKNLVFPTPETEKIAKQRLIICLGDGKDKPRCNLAGKFPVDHCRLCGCPIDAKVRSFTLDNKCKVNKWGVHAINTETV